MSDFAMAVAGGIAFGIITYRIIRMGLRAYRENQRKRLLDHLSWRDHDVVRRRA
jgi:xanthine/uracil/vitamin C permease (AzgA family)